MKALLIIFIYSLIGGIHYFWVMFLFPKKTEWELREMQAALCGIFWPIGFFVMCAAILGKICFDYINGLFKRIEK